MMITDLSATLNSPSGYAFMCLHYCPVKREGPRRKRMLGKGLRLKRPVVDLNSRGLGICEYRQAMLLFVRYSDAVSHSRSIDGG